MNTLLEFYKSVLKMIDYLEHDEQRDWVELNKPDNHIYKSVKFAKDYLKGRVE